MMKSLGYKKFLRFALLAYMGIFLIAIGLYISQHFKFYQIDWTRYENDSDYYVWVNEKVKPMGVLRILGNQKQIQDFWLLLPFLVGIFLSAFIFVQLWRSYVGRTLAPLFAFAGYLLPVIVRLNENLVAGLIFGTILILMGSLGTVWMTKGFDDYKRRDKTNHDMPF